MIAQWYSSDVRFEVSALDGVYVPLVTCIQELVSVARIPQAWVFRNTLISLTTKVANEAFLNQVLQMANVPSKGHKVAVLV